MSENVNPDEGQSSSAAGTSAGIRRVGDAKPEEKRALFMMELRRLSSALPSPYREMITNEMLESLADALVDGTVFEILNGLREVQKLTENDLYQRRCQLIQEQQRQRTDIQMQNGPVMSSTTFYSHAQPHYGGGNSHGGGNQQEMLKFDKQCQEELKRMDMKIVLELDQMVSQQQQTLEKAGIPSFCVTNKHDPLKLQMFIVQFMDKLRITNATAINLNP